MTLPVRTPDEFVAGVVAGAVSGYATAVALDAGWAGLLVFTVGLGVGVAGAYGVMRLWARRSKRGV